MALNKFMHPRNIYKTRKPDFAQLALDYPIFQKHVTQDLSGKVYVDFKNPESLRALTLTLLQHDFSLNIELPLDRLIPTVPLRLNYIHWIEDILSDTKGVVTGIDIGTGSSCIYPLLSCRLNPKWLFQATDVDSVNIDHAKRNVMSNSLQEQITVRQVTGGSILLDLVQDGGGERQFDFCMCNPPFFADHMDAQAIMSTRSDERPDPSSVSTAHDVESIVRGGEVGFVNRMIAESVQLKHTVRVYSTMIGKKSSIALIKDELRRCQVPRYSTTEFCQGKTMRWGIAWSFDLAVKFPKSVFKEKHKEKPPLTYKIPNNAGSSVVYELIPLAENIKDILKELQIEFQEIKTSKDWLSIQLCARQNTWSHQRRRRRQIKRESNIPPANPDQIETGIPDVIMQAPSEHAVTITDSSCHVESNHVTETGVSTDPKTVLDDSIKCSDADYPGTGDASIVRLHEGSFLLFDSLEPKSNFEKQTTKSIGSNADLDHVKNSVSFLSETDHKDLVVKQNGCYLDIEKDLLLNKRVNEVYACQMITNDVEAPVDSKETEHCSKKKPLEEDGTRDEVDCKKHKLVDSSPVRHVIHDDMHNGNHIQSSNDVKNSVCPEPVAASHLVSSSTEASLTEDPMQLSNQSDDTSEQIQNETHRSSKHENEDKINNSDNICNIAGVSVSADLTSSVVLSSAQRAEACSSNSTHTPDSQQVDGMMLNKTEYLFRSILTLKKMCSSYMIEMSWMDGQNRELMHQLFQFFKNTFK